MAQHYGEHIAHRDWMGIMSGMTNKNPKPLENRPNRSYLRDGNDDEGELVNEFNDKTIINNPVERHEL